jgi:putative oxidoreductase
MKPKLYFLFCFLLIVLFTYTAFSKWLNIEAHLYAMRNQPFSRPLNDFLAYALPVIEIITVVLLVINSTRLLALYLSLLLMALFTAYVAAVLLGLFGRIPCSCGGVIELLGWNEHLVFNIFFLLISIIAIRLHKHIHA